MEEPLKIAVCEDTDSERLGIIRLLENSPYPNTSVPFASGEEFLQNFDPDQCDLILMDIFLTGISGVEVIARLREKNIDIPTAFVTTSLDFTLEGYRLDVLRYIEKPVRQKDIDDILQLAIMYRENKPSFTFQKNGTAMKVPLNDIIYFEQNGHQISLNMRNKEEISLYGKISEIIGRLPSEQFYSPHKSFIVNFSYVDYLDRDLRCFVMKNGTNIPISRDKIVKARKAMEAYLFSDRN